MKQKPFLLNILLASCLTVALGIMTVVRTIQPAAILPPINIPNMVLLSLIVLLCEHFLAPNTPRKYPIIAIFSLIAFSLLPFVAGFTDFSDFWKYGLIGCGVFTAVTWLFTSMTQRLATGPKAKTALFAGCLGIYLAFQAFVGILL